MRCRICIFSSFLQNNLLSLLGFFHVLALVYAGIRAVVVDLHCIFVFSAVTAESGPKAQVLQMIREALCLNFQILS